MHSGTNKAAGTHGRGFPFQGVSVRLGEVAGVVEALRWEAAVASGTNRQSGQPGPEQIERMAKVFPEDFGRVEALYPFVRSVVARNEFRKRLLAQARA